MLYVVVDAAAVVCDVVRDALSMRLLTERTGEWLVFNGRKMIS